MHFIHPYSSWSSGRGRCVQPPAWMSSWSLQIIQIGSCGNVGWDCSSRRLSPLRRQEAPIAPHATLPSPTAWRYSKVGDTRHWTAGLSQMLLLIRHQLFSKVYKTSEIFRFSASDCVGLEWVEPTQWLSKPAKPSNGSKRLLLQMSWDLIRESPLLVWVWKEHHCFFARKLEVSSSTNTKYD